MTDSYDCIKCAPERDERFYAVKDLLSNLYYHFSSEEAARAFCYEIERPSYVG